MELAMTELSRPVREIRTLGAMWRGLETDSRFGFQGTPGGNGEQQARLDLRNTAPVLDLTGQREAFKVSP